MKKRQKTGKIQEIAEYLSQFKAGTAISFADIQAATGVELVESTANRQLVRRALNQLELEYEPIISWGIKLADASNTAKLLRRRAFDVGTKVQRMETTHERLCQKFYDQLPPHEKRYVSLIGGVIAAYRNASRVLHQPHPDPAPPRPVLPV